MDSSALPNEPRLIYTARVSEPETTEVVEVIEIDEPVAEAEIASATAEVPPPSKEPGNPDAWLQWALIIGILALFLICAILILVAWNGR